MCVSFTKPENNHIHQGGILLSSGCQLNEARNAMILLHGRGASAEDILFLADLINLPGYAYLAPEAKDRSWYPYPFTTPIHKNEPWLTSSLTLIRELISQIQAEEIPTQNIVLGGFSQGACLSAEFAARNPERFGGILIFSGGLIGPPGTIRTSPGSLSGTPVFIGCSDRDPHIPLDRVNESGDLLSQLGGNVIKKIYPNLAHTVHPNEIEIARDLLTPG